MHDSGLLAGRTEIGKTEIDLENRYFAKCYSTCGLPQRFSSTGYNAWRDALTPFEILFKMCKQFGLKRPEYEDDRLIIMKPNSSQKFEYKNTLNMIDNLNAHNKPASKDTKPTQDQISENLKQQLALDALNDWKNITGVCF